MTYSRSSASVTQRSHLPSVDLAGSLTAPLTQQQIKTRIDRLIRRAFAPAVLNLHLDDYPEQLTQPHTRPWQPIDWSCVSTNHLLAISPEMFLAILSGIIDTEAPIRGYTQTSRQYLEPIHRPLARLVGGLSDQTGQLTELGLWEKEERRHAPALTRLYQKLTGTPYKPTPKITKPYQPSDHPSADLFQHGLHRIMTEYGASCLYLWLAALTTGPVQQLLWEILQDEVNHLSKFWGAGRWLYPIPLSQQVWQWLRHGLQGQDLPQRNFRMKIGRSLTKFIQTGDHMREVLHWQKWQLVHRLQFLYATHEIARHFWQWNQTLSQNYLQQQLATTATGRSPHN